MADTLKIIDENISLRLKIFNEKKEFNKKKVALESSIKYLKEDIAAVKEKLQDDPFEVVPHSKSNPVSKCV